jgi:hypothetical protein
MTVTGPNNGDSVKRRNSLIEAWLVFCPSARWMSALVVPAVMLRSMLSMSSPQPVEVDGAPRHLATENEQTDVATRASALFGQSFDVSDGGDAGHHRPHLRSVMPS